MDLSPGESTFGWNDTFRSTYDPVGQYDPVGSPVMVVSHLKKG